MLDIRRLSVRIIHFLHIFVGENHRNLNLKCTVIIGQRFTLDKHFRVCAVITIPPPPKGFAAVNCIFHLRPLYRNAAVGLGESGHHHRVAHRIAFVHLWKFHHKRRAFVFFHIERSGAIAVCLYRESTRESRLWQDEIARGCSELVGRHRLLFHFLIVGISQCQHHILTGDNRHRIVWIALMKDKAGMHRLSRTVNSTVGKHPTVGMDALVGIVVIMTSQC